MDNPGALDLAAINQQLRHQHPADIVKWAVALNKKTVVTTNFRPFEAVILHLCQQADPHMDVLWIDSGYNTKATYLCAEKIIQQLALNLHVFNPLMTAARRDALMDGIPDIDSPLHEEFTRQVKLEPFSRAMKQFQPEVWLTAIRKDQTAFRQNLDIVTQDETGLLKVAPLFYWSEVDMEGYLYEHSLPNEEDYYDPTKVLGDRECGLHTRSPVAS
ncbi:phosphoadenosine phosphosulfate reductase family protein [Ketobacter sp.]|uniref:phosphoadenosine phosphosulfate reductase domain-containing protein n=1 Tax=Ketobacter sp. TaxID=2083498 RepID=UPI000F161E11|nr:phosphoadenosine phosphosulfate reductase family protein [Ketobacter sp.]RLU00148.1 MAG: phosphoadenylylsulfate reductase [Ketobacter sp.]